MVSKLVKNRLKSYGLKTHQNKVCKEDKVWSNTFYDFLTNEESMLRHHGFKFQIEFKAALWLFKNFGLSDRRDLLFARKTLADVGSGN